VLGINAPGIVEFKPSGSKPPVIKIDTGAHFQTTMTSEDRDVLIEWACNIAVRLNFGIIIGKSDFGADRRKPYFTLVCERSGTYVLKGKKLKKEKTETRKCQCPFRLRGYFHRTDGKWHMTVVDGTHNHELDKGLEGHLVVGRLKRNIIVQFTFI
jgi:alpha-glucosidase